MKVILLLISFLIIFFPVLSLQETADNNEDYNYTLIKSWEQFHVFDNGGVQIQEDFDFKTRNTFSVMNPVIFNVTATVFGSNSVEELVVLFHSPGKTPETLITGNIRSGIQKLIQYGHAFDIPKIEGSKNTFYLEDIWMPQVSGGLVISGIVILQNGSAVPLLDQGIILNVESFLAYEQFEANKEIFKQSEKLDELQSKITQLEKQNEFSGSLNIVLGGISIGLAVLAFFGFKYNKSKKSN